MMINSLVSVIIPCYNEVDFIADCLDSVLASDYDRGSLEIIVVDGLSTDGTRNILADYQQDYALLKVVDNPKRNKPRALNIGIQAARGSIIIRMDAHALYSPDYISKSVEYLEKYQADNVGGIRKTVPSNDSIMARAIAHAISHPFAAGNATYRTGANEIRWVDTVFGGCYRREVFDRIGFFDEALVRGQDREFNSRLQRSGGKILLVPDIVCYYFPRSDLDSYLEWIHVGGLTPFYISRITRQVIFSWRNLVPLAFVLGLVATLILSLVYRLFLLLFRGIAVTYLAAAVIASISIAQKERDVRFLAIMPWIFMITHVAYGSGSLVGLVKPIEHESEWTKV